MYNNSFNVNQIILKGQNYAYFFWNRTHGVGGMGNRVTETANTNSKMFTFLQ